jgi:phosphopantetheinyl transferase
VDIEIPTEKIGRIMHKFLSAKEHEIFNLVPGVGNSIADDFRQSALLWSAKESVFKWYGNGSVDFRKEIQLLQQHGGNETIDCFFSKDEFELTIHYRQFGGLVLAWLIS